jgi:hypothetical protein
MFALAVLLPSMALARTQFLCDVDQVVREACCCPPKQASQPITTAPATAMRSECCKLEKHAGAAVPLATEAVGQPAPPLVAVSVVVAALVVPVRDGLVPVIPRAQAPPPERTLLSQHAALLL